MRNCLHLLLGTLLPCKHSNDLSQYYALSFPYSSFFTLRLASWRKRSQPVFYYYNVKNPLSNCYENPKTVVHFALLWYKDAFSGQRFLHQPRCGNCAVKAWRNCVWANQLSTWSLVGMKALLWPQLCRSLHLMLCVMAMLLAKEARSHHSKCEYDALNCPVYRFIPYVLLMVSVIFCTLTSLKLCFC